MLCYKIEINELERFMQTIEIEILKSDCFTQGQAFIYLSCFQRSTFRKKHSENSVTQIYTEFRNFIFLPTGKL